VPPLDFYKLTPREAVLAINAKAYNLRRQHEMIVWHSWHTAAFHRVKKMPPWNRVKPRYDDSPGRNRMNWKQQLKMVEAINFALGGKDKRGAE